MDRPEPLDPNPISRPGVAAGEMPASTGGVVDLDRIIGNIPVVFIFLPSSGVSDDRGVEPTVEVLRRLGDRLIEFGTRRIQVLGVHPADVEEVILLGREADTTARVVSDAERRLADAFGVVYDDRVHVVVVGNDGDVVDSWSDDAVGEFADRVLDRTTALGFTA